MEWFFERICSNANPIHFGKRERQKHPVDFQKLVAWGWVKPAPNLESVDCELCEEPHECQVRQNGTELFYVCENGSGKSVLAPEDLTTYELDMVAFLESVRQDLAIQGILIDETIDEHKLWKLGEKDGWHFYYLTDPNSLEFERLRNDVQNVHDVRNIVFINKAAPHLPQAQNLIFVVLPELLGSTRFDAKKLQNAFVSARAVQFDIRTGNLCLDGELLHSFGTSNERKYFVEKLWRDFEKPVSNDALARYIRQKMGSDVADTAQKYCNKVKSDIFKQCASIGQVIVQPQRNEYMLRNPDR